jgi:hypothetical protein
MTTCKMSVWQEGGMGDGDQNYSERVMGRVGRWVEWGM